jgi:hypothetical protein
MFCDISLNAMQIICQQNLTGILQDPAFEVSSQKHSVPTEQR